MRDNIAEMKLCWIVFIFAYFIPKSEELLNSYRSRPTVSTSTKISKTVLTKPQERYKEDCFPMSTGCQCIEEETVIRYIDDEDCKVPSFVNNNSDNLDEGDEEEREDQQTTTVPKNNTRGYRTDEQIVQGQRAVINEMNERFKNYKENCFPLPKKRCQCVETVNGKETVTKYDDENVSCKVTPKPAQTNSGK